MARDRILSGDNRPGDEPIDVALRPHHLDEMVGQRAVLDKLVEVLVAWGDPRGEAERWLSRAAQLRPGLDSADEWVRVAYRIKTGVEG